MIGSTKNVLSKIEHMIERVLAKIMFQATPFGVLFAFFISMYVG